MRLGLLAFGVAALLLVPASGSAKKKRPTPCDPGRFLLAPSDTALLGAGVPPVDAVVLEAGGAVSLGVCGSAPAHPKASKKATALNARWAKCGTLAGERLLGRIASPACDTLTAILKPKKGKAKRFTAKRSRCGDGRLDAGGGEACDTGADGACPGACHAPGTPGACQCRAVSSTTTTTLPVGQPIVAPTGTWTWVDFPDAACDDGSPTGIGVNLAASQNVLVLLIGGGACWDYQTCYYLNTAVHGPFGQTEFTNAAANFANSILDRQLANNPFAAWNLVYVPYCTGDLHAGNNVAVYTNGSVTKMHHHVGHANVLAYLKRLKPTFPTVDKLVVSGISAGGFGALFNFRDFRSRWPTGALYLLDDSGPLLENASFSANFETSWFANWHLAEVTDPVCGAACQSDLSLMQSALAAAYPGDRMALLSSEQDTTVRNSYLLSGSQFQTALLAMATDRLDPTTRFRYFFTGGSNHTMLVAPASVSQNSVALLTWLGQLVDDDPGWTTVKP